MIHNYAKYAAIHVYVLFVAIAINILIYATDISNQLSVPQDALRLAMTIILIALFIFSSIYAVKSLMKTKEINKISKDELENMLKNLKEKDYKTQKNLLDDIYKKFKTHKYIDLLNIQEKRNEKNICIQLIITPIDYQPFWIEVLPFVIMITIKDVKIVTFEWVAHKDFFTRN